jgi:deoxyribodipyrimidine photolyase
VGKRFAAHRGLEVLIARDIPLGVAGVRPLNQTGWAHNRVRMIVASNLVKDLLIDWRWGEH